MACSKASSVWMAVMGYLPADVDLAGDGGGYQGDAILAQAFNMGAYPAD